MSADPSKIDVDPKSGAVTIPAQGAYSGASIPQSAIQSNMARYDATLNRRGQTPQFLGTGGYMGTQNPQSGITAGDQANPYLPKSTTDLNAIPDGSWFVSPQDGKTYQKAGSQAQKTTQADTGGTGAQLASAGDGTGQQQPDYSDLAQMTPSNTPGTFDLGTLPLGGGDQGTDLADAIRQAQVGQSLQGVA